jgi:hypothetical protein
VAFVNCDPLSCRYVESPRSTLASCTSVVFCGIVSRFVFLDNWRLRWGVFAVCFAFLLAFKSNCTSRSKFRPQKCTSEELAMCCIGVGLYSFADMVHRTASAAEPQQRSVLVCFIDDAYCHFCMPACPAGLLRNDVSNFIHFLSDLPRKH